MHDDSAEKARFSVGIAIKIGIGMFFFQLGTAIFFGLGLSSGLQGWRLIALALGAGTLMGAGAVLGAPALAGGLGRAAGGLFYPEASFDGPQPVYGPAEAMAAAGQYEEALDAFEELLEEFPGETRAYARMIEILLYELRDRGRAAAVLDRAEKALSDADAKAEIEQIFQEGCEEIERERTARGRVDLAPDDQNT